jgi:excinuclease UvrABC ATPase subunit
MGLEKAIEFGKEKRQEYIFEEGHGDSRAVDRSCRNHGSCPYCEGNRLYKRHLQEQAADDEIREWLDSSIVLLQVSGD